MLFRSVIAELPLPGKPQPADDSGIDQKCAQKEQKQAKSPRQNGYGYSISHIAQKHASRAKDFLYLSHLAANMKKIEKSVDILEIRDIINLTRYVNAETGRSSFPEAFRELSLGARQQGRRSERHPRAVRANRPWL